MCLVNLIIEHELKAVRKRVTSFVSDDRAEVSYFLYAFNALCIMNMATYETFAAVYDAVMDDSLYDLWTDFSLRHLPKSKDRKKLLEIGLWDRDPVCSLFSSWFDVTGLDLSADMLKIAEKRAASAKQKIDFIEGNMLDLSQAGKYDFVTCYSDSILLYAGRSRGWGCLQGGLQCP